MNNLNWGYVFFCTEVFWLFKNVNLIASTTQTNRRKRNTEIYRHHTNASLGTVRQ